MENLETENLQRIGPEHLVQQVLNNGKNMGELVTQTSGFKNERLSDKLLQFSEAQFLIHRIKTTL